MGALPSTASLSCEDAVKAAAAAAAAFSVSMLSSLRSPLEERGGRGDTDGLGTAGLAHSAASGHASRGAVH